MGCQMAGGTLIMFRSERNSIRYGRMSCGSGESGEPVFMRTMPVFSFLKTIIGTIAKACAENDLRCGGCTVIAAKRGASGVPNASQAESCCALGDMSQCWLGCSGRSGNADILIRWLSDRGRREQRSNGQWPFCLAVKMCIWNIPRR